MRDIPQGEGRPPARAPQPAEIGNTPSTIHHRLNYLAQDAWTLGMAQAAKLLEMMAQMALDETNALSARH
jgi:hypothetical protein